MTLISFQEMKKIKACKNVKVLQISTIKLLKTILFYGKHLLLQILKLKVSMLNLSLHLQTKVEIFNRIINLMPFRIFLKLKMPFLQQLGNQMRILIETKYNNNTLKIFRFKIQSHCRLHSF